MAKVPTGPMPINAMMGWNDGIESKDVAVEFAKGFITQRYTAIEASWYTVAPFLGGYLWEVHEGGHGKGYAGAVIEALTENPSSTFWFPSGDRAFQVMMRDGKPFGILLSKKDSLAVLNSGQPPLAMGTKMKPAVRKGTGWFVTGASMLAIGGVFLASSMTFYGLVSNPGPSVPAVNFAEMPHAQWNMVASTDVEEIVSKLELADAQWRVEKREHVIEGIEDIRAEGRQLQQRAVNETAPMPDMSQIQIDDPGPDSHEVPVTEEDQVEPFAEEVTTDMSEMSAAERRRALREARGGLALPDEINDLIEQTEDGE